MSGKQKQKRQKTGGSAADDVAESSFTKDLEVLRLQPFFYFPSRAIFFSFRESFRPPCVSSKRWQFDNSIQSDPVQNSATAYDGLLLGKQL